MLNKKNTISAMCVIMSVLMVLLSVALPVSAESEKLTADSTAQIPVNPEDKIDSALKEKMATASPEEKIPVAIWYTDVDQAQIDTLTAEKVGFSAEEVAEDYEMPSTTLLNNLKEGQDGADAQMQAYLERTKKQRESERKRTDDYIMTRREFSRAKYNEKSAKLIKDIQLNEADITFNSQYAPMIIVELTVSEILKIKDNSFVSKLHNISDADWVLDSLDSGKENTGVDKINIGTDLNLSGDCIKVGLIDGDAVYVSETGVPNHYIVPENKTPTIRYSLHGDKLTDYGNVVIIGNDTGVTTGSHADKVANTLLSVAPNVVIYSLAIRNYTSFSKVEELLYEGVQILSMSIGQPEEEFTDEYTYSLLDKWFDHIIAMHDVVVVKSAGNTGMNPHDDVIMKNGKEEKVYGPIVGAPGLGYNVITVGAYNDTTNTFYSETSYRNSITLDDGTSMIGCEKPDVVLPSSFNGGGTSVATPFLAGMLALVFELKPSVASLPEATKAIVLASCHKKSNQLVGEQEYIGQGVTERQGVGIPDAWIMASIVSCGTYGTGRFIGSRTQAIRRFCMPKYNASNMNVSITWIKENVYDNTSHLPLPSVTDGEYVNLDLYVYRNNQLVGSSRIGTVNNKKSSTEMAYVPLNSSQWNYEIRIQKATSTNETVRYGYAYSTDESYIAPASEEGIYYIRNYYSDKYLTLNSNNEAVMENFTGGEAQQWVIKGTPGHYELCPAFANEGTKINFGAKVGSNPYYKAVTGTSNLNLSMRSWETDTSLEPDAYVFTSASGGNNNILSYTSSTGVFVRSTGAPVINNYRMWVLEDINYRPGDMDYNGTLDVTDATKIGLYIAGSGTYKNIQSVLLDFNCDGVVNVTDTTDLRKYIAGLPY